VTTYSAFLLPNPYRLVIDIQGSQRTNSASAPAPSRRSPPPDSPVPTTSPTLTARLEPAPARTEIKSEPAETSATKPVSSTKKPKTKPAEAAPVPIASAPQWETDAKPAETVPVRSADADPTIEEATKTSATPGNATGNIEIPSTNGPTTEPVYAKVSSEATPASRAARPTRIDSTRTIAAPSPNSSGQRSLTRALGLKIGRVMIDAGHGGHDTGTIGPSGYTEKDLVLDVALRLGAMVEERLGSEVVYTRNDDTFVPLEMRTAIANQKQADLFVSIHANASRDAKARGVETYYLSFSTSQDTLETAARENAVSEKSIHELQDLVKKITLYEKVEESKEFAADVQKSLYTGISRGNAGLRNRGVRKAPFVVLIGANMPSILAEISFVSNPQDEKLLKKPEYRQRIAESLFRGIQQYAGSLGGVKVASQRAEVPGQ
jgi:N-acetylmuramoyl-L-alanine amidase